MHNLDDQIEKIQMDRNLIRNENNLVVRFQLELYSSWPNYYYY